MTMGKIDNIRKFPGIKVRSHYNRDKAKEKKDGRLQAIREKNLLLPQSLVLNSHGHVGRDVATQVRDGLLQHAHQ
ncbi:hypothetical protein O6P43_002263 [Quillaja saponaria]|uniref:Uncharacterized protein n=1 Tax=Quillaja saponaria TaxID=32244 RepID=A0AAD7VK19_QUISA|nr:hypothetical protein O6P43_002263 [Quillaja saponaria]